MSNDTYNPFEAEEVNLQDILKKVVAEKLRQRPSMNDASARFLYASGQAKADKDFDSALSKRTELAEADKAAISKTLRNYGEETERLGGNRLTFPQAMTNVKEAESMRLDDEDRARANARIQARMQGGDGSSGGTGGSALPMTQTQALYAEAMEAIQSSRPRRQKWGEDVLKQLQGHDPKNSMRYNAQGGAEEIPGAPALFERQQGITRQQANPLGVKDYPMGDGSTGYQQPPRPPGVQVGPSLNGAAPSAAPPTAPGTQGGGGGGVSGPSSPAPDLSGGPVGAGAATGMTAGMGAGNAQIDPRAQMAADEQAIQQLANEYAQTKDPQTLAQLNYRIAQVEKAKATGGQPRTTPPGFDTPGARMPTPQAPPGAVDRGQYTRPTGAPGTTPAPSDVHNYQKSREDDLKALHEQEKLSGGIYPRLKQIEELKELNKKQLYSGYGEQTFGVLQKVGATFSGKASKEFEDSAEFNARVKSMSADIAKQYGYNPSNIDLQTALAQLPELSNTQAGRAKILAWMESALKYEEASRVPIRKMVEGGMSLVQAQQIFDGMYRNQQDRDKAKAGGAPGNPTQGGETPLAGAVAAASKGGNPPAGPSPVASVRAQDRALEQDARGGSVAGFAKDVFDSAADLAKGTFSKQRYEAFGDTIHELSEGALQLLTLGNFGDERYKEKVAQEIAARKQRAEDDPRGYGQSRILTDIVNPFTFAGGPVGGGAGQVATRALPMIANNFFQGAIRPQDTLGTQLEEGGKNALFALPFTVASKFLPKTAAHPDVSHGGDLEQRLAQFPETAKTVKSYQLDPNSVEARMARTSGAVENNSLAQAKALTKDLMNQAGIPGERITEHGIAQARAAADEVQKGILGNDPLKISSTGKNGMIQAVEALVKSKGKLDEHSMLHDFILSSSKSGKPSPKAAKALQERFDKMSTGDIAIMWDEVNTSGASKEAQKLAKNALENMIYESKGSDALDAFKKAKSRHDDITAIESLWSQGKGSGVGPGTGILNPAHLKLEAGTRVKGSITDQATEIADMLGMKNPRPLTEVGGTTIAGVIKSIMGPTIGKLGNVTDLTAINASPSTKRIIDLLRAGTHGAGISTAGVRDAP
jgi:hypothetical protein